MQLFSGDSANFNNINKKINVCKHKVEKPALKSSEMQCWTEGRSSTAVAEV